jgi:hypothetical protein
MPLYIVFVFLRRTTGKLRSWRPQRDQHAHDVVVSFCAGAVRLSLQPQMSGAVVASESSRVTAAECSAEVHVNKNVLIRSGPQFMAIAMDGESLDRSRRALLLPIGAGEMRIAGAGRWRQPMMLAGEVTGAQWKICERFQLRQNASGFEIPLTSAVSLSRMILCEVADQGSSHTTSRAGQPALVAGLWKERTKSQCS